MNEMVRLLRVAFQFAPVNTPTIWKDCATFSEGGTTAKRLAIYEPLQNYGVLLRDWTVFASNKMIKKPKTAANAANITAPTKKLNSQKIFE